MLNQKRQKQSAQTVIEYTLIVTIILAVATIMGTMLRRSSQGWLKLVADQVGIQNRADQSFNDVSQGHLIVSYFNSRSSINKDRLDVAGVINYVFTDDINSTTNTLTNLGFQERQ